MPFDLASTGLSKQTIDALCGVFVRHQAVEQVILYGSRAKGTFRPGSDIDLTIKGALAFPELLQIESEIDDLLLPYKLDLSLLNQIENPDLLAHIERVGVVFFDKAIC